LVHLRTVLVCTLLLLAVVSGSLSITPPPPVQACNGCNFLLTWGTNGSNPSQFDSPWGVAVDSAGNVYVTDQNNDRVEKFTSTGAYVTAWGCTTAASGCSSGSGPGEFHRPLGIAVDSSGNVYVTDYTNNRVEKFTSTGHYITAWGCATAGTGCPGSSTPGELNEPYGLAVDSSGNVYVADFSNSRVEKFTSTGTFIATIASSGSGPGNVDGPVGVAVDSGGNVYVADDGNNRIEKLTSTGAYLTAWGCTDAGDGCPGGSGPGEFNYPQSVAVDSAGNVYAADYGGNRVEKFTSTGTYVTAWGCATAGTGCPGSSTPGELNEPHGIAADSAGNVYVVDVQNYRIELFSDLTSASISLVTGWNLISLPLVPLYKGIGSLLGGLISGHNFTIVWSYQGGVWKSFTPPSTGPLTTMQDGFGYWIHVTNPSTLTELGYVFAPPPSTPPSYTLSAGWNLLGFKPQPDPTAPETVSVYLTSITGDYNTNNVWIYDNPTSTWVRATGSTSIPVGEALWVYMTTPATLRP